MARIEALQPDPCPSCGERKRCMILPDVGLRTVCPECFHMAIIWAAKQAGKEADAMEFVVVESPKVPEM